MKLGRIKVLKNNLLHVNGNQGEPNFLKATLFRLTEMDFRALFLLVETIIEIRQNSIFKLFLLGEVYSFYFLRKRILRLVESIFFLHFSETPVSFFQSSRIVFLNEILYSGWFSFGWSFSSKWKPSLKLTEANF